MANRVIFLQS